MSHDTQLTARERERYDRQIILPGWGEERQCALKGATVFIAGSGGLGSAVALYLAAAGVGVLRVCDHGEVELSNLNRQILHGDRDVGRKKVRSAGGHTQDYVRRSPQRMRSAWLELFHGTRLALWYPRNPREFLWTLLLFPARVHLWLLVFINVRLLRRPLVKLWQRVESTK